jgi:hypothetical protein
MSKCRPSAFNPVVLLSNPFIYRTSPATPYVALFAAKKFPPRAKVDSLYGPVFAIARKKRVSTASFSPPRRNFLLHSPDGPVE